MAKFQSTRPVWGATAVPAWWQLHTAISIHAPRVGRDSSTRRSRRRASHFNPRAPCGARQFDEEIAATGIPFQSTRPVWGATAVPAWWQLHTAISIHAPRAGCDAGRRGHLTSRASISIHAPRARCDNVRSVQGGWLPVFQSTHPVRGATLRGSVSSPARSGFQSTHPVRGATMDKAAAAGNNEFQSTRPVWGATLFYGISGRWEIFQSTRPVWGATTSVRQPFAAIGFQSTRPVWGATANLTILPRQICTKGTKEFLLGRKTHGKKEK